MSVAGDCHDRQWMRPPSASQSGDRRDWALEHRRRLDRTPEGLATARLRIARPVEALTHEALLARGLTPAQIEQCGRRRGYKWIDLGLEDLELAGLIRQRWDRKRLDDRIHVLARRREGRQVLASLFTPALRYQLELLWDSMHEFGGGTFWCSRLLGALY